MPVFSSHFPFGRLHTKLAHELVYTLQIGEVGTAPWVICCRYLDLSEHSVFVYSPYAKCSFCKNHCYRRWRFSNASVIDRTEIYDYVKGFGIGSILHSKGTHWRDLLTEEELDGVGDRFVTSSRKSLARLAQQTAVFASSIRNVI